MAGAYAVQSVSASTLRAINYAPQLDRLRLPPSGAHAKHWTHRALGALIPDIGKTYAKVLTRVDCAPSHGDDLLSQVDVFSIEPHGRTIRGDLMSFREDLRIRRGDVLIAGAGQIGESTLFGRALIADSRLVGKLAAGDLMVLRPEDPGEDRFLCTYAFLLSSAGLRGIRAAAYGTSIPRIRPDLLAALPVPVVGDAVERRVAAAVRLCMQQREIYHRELIAARTVVERLPVMSEASSMCAERKARAAAWDGSLSTLNAWNYASTGAALPFLLKKWPGRIRDVVPPDGLFRGGRYQRVPCRTPWGIDFLDQRDVFSIRPTPRRIAEPTVPKQWVYVPEFSLLAGGQGTLGEGELFGQVALVTPDIASTGITEHLLRIQPSTRAAAALLYAYLSTITGRRLLRTAGVGTKLLSLRPDLVFALPIPELGEDAIADIVKHLEAAVAARVASVREEAKAVRIIEEEVLPAWLA